VNKIHNNYVHSLSTLLPFAEKRVETLREEIQFTEAMADLVQTHSNTIAILAKGFLEARKYISAKEVTQFLDEHLRARIGTRLIAEQHIALHFSSKPHSRLQDEDPSKYRESTFIGVIDTALKPAALVRTCENTVGEICELKYGVRPTVKIIGSEEATIAHVPMHLEYILTELLKNSFRATIEAGMEKEPVEVTIAPSPAIGGPIDLNKKDEDHTQYDSGVISNYDQGSVDLASGTNKPSSASANIRALENGTPGVTIRIRDRGGGINPDVHSKLWEYGFTTFNEDEINEKTGSGQGITALDVISGGAGGGSSLAGLGYGLPLGRAYAEYFGGGIAVQSLWGWGTDVYLTLRGVGKVE
jgi:signal transduction histidine kinase